MPVIPCQSLTRCLKPRRLFKNDMKYLTLSLMVAGFGLAMVQNITAADKIKEKLGVLLTGEPCVSEEALANTDGSAAERIRKQIEAVLESEINPAIASHGGVITILDVQNGVVYVKMGGGCQGCASSTATLKQGVEQAIRAHVPDVVEILDTTDHAAGTNPYYSPSF